jgi:hypothetical protein
MRDFRDAKAMAYALRDALKSRAIETTHSESLELIANAFGYDNWNVLAAKIEAAQPRAGAMAALAPVGAANSASHETLHCSFCGNSEHRVKKLIAGPLVLICDQCVELCADIVRDEDPQPLWMVLRLLAKGGNDAHAAVAEHIRGRSTEDLAAYMEAGRPGATGSRRSTPI